MLDRLWKSWEEIVWTARDLASGTTTAYHGLGMKKADSTQKFAFITMESRKESLLFLQEAKLFLVKNFAEQVN